eukprot:359185-Chlamydomonas_euryale.AAC.8
MDARAPVGCVTAVDPSASPARRRREDCSAQTPSERDRDPNIAAVARYAPPLPPLARPSDACAQPKPTAQLFTYMAARGGTPTTRGSAGRSMIDAHHGARSARMEHRPHAGKEAVRTDSQDARSRAH